MRITPNHKRQWKRPQQESFLAGVFSTVAYGLALYAKSIAPLGIVTALRETSVIIATLIGVIWFKEKPIGYRIGAASIVFCGIVFLAL